MSTHRRAAGQKPEIAVAVRMPTLNLEFSRDLQRAMSRAAEESALNVYYAALKAFYREQDLRRIHGLRPLKRILLRHLGVGRSQA